MTMLRWLAIPFAWRRVERPSPSWTYRENKITGDREAIRHQSGGYSPLSMEWLQDAPRHRIIDPLTATGRQWRK